MLFDFVVFGPGNCRMPFHHAAAMLEAWPIHAAGSLTAVSWGGGLDVVVLNTVYGI